MDPEVFFPVGVSGAVWERQVAAAKRVCAGCAVRVECLADALARFSDGVAGGLSAEERRQPRPVVAVVGGPVGAGDPPWDWVVVQRIKRAGSEPGASGTEIAVAALELVEQGRSVAQVAAHLNRSAVMVARWVARSRAGQPLVWRHGVRGPAA